MSQSGFLALTRVPREIWQISEASLHGVSVLIPNKCSGNKPISVHVSNVQQLSLLNFIGYINWHWFTWINLLIRSFNELPEWSFPFGWKRLKANLRGTHPFTPFSSSCIADSVQESEEEPRTMKIMFLFCFWNQWPRILCSQMRP